tara:strand:- start:892 stop:1074 length:183 start_codon:yes stop_codon:yes gene_type:complete
MKYLLIMVTMTSASEGKVDVLSRHETISECHVAMTQRTWNMFPEAHFCLITELGVDWKIK